MRMLTNPTHFYSEYGGRICLRDVENTAHIRMIQTSKSRIDIKKEKKNNYYLGNTMYK
jgi:hypothetical protein